MAGFRTWSPGEVITASNINEYLQNQAVMVFADAATRTSTISVPLEGMLSWVEDDNKYQFYDGAEWGDLIVPIEGGTAGQAYVSNGASAAAFGDMNSKFVATTVTEKTTDYTVSAADVNTIIQTTGTGDAIITFDDVLSIGDSIQVIRNGTGSAFLSPGSGVTSWAGIGTETTSDFYIDTQYGVAAIIKTAANEYRVIGRISI